MLLENRAKTDRKVETFYFCASHFHIKANYLIILNIEVMLSGVNDKMYDQILLSEIQAKSSILGDLYLIRKVLNIVKPTIVVAF